MGSAPLNRSFQTLCPFPRHGVVE